jgi:signal transduction histidine kinase
MIRGRWGHVPDTTDDGVPEVSVADALASVGLDDLLRGVLQRVGQVVDDQRRLRLLLDAVVSLAADLSLDSVLDRIVRTASELAGARYAALGVLGFGADRRLQAFVTFGLTDAQRASIGDLPRGHGILGHIIDRPEPLRLHDLSSHPASYGFPPEHPPMSSFLGVPIRIREKVFGNLYLTEKADGGDFTEQDETIVVALAAAAGVVIENARLYAETAKRERWLAASAEINALLLGQADRHAALAAVADRAREISGADYASVSLRRSEDEIEVEVVSGVPMEEDAARVLPITGSVAGMVVVSGEPVVIEDLGEDPRALRTALGELSESVGPMVLVPLRTADGVAGVLGLAWRRENAFRFHELDVELPQRFAEQAALALEVARARLDQEKLSLLEDRDRIGRDLHDLVIQRLFAVGLTLQNTTRMVELPQAHERIARAVDDIDATIKDIRHSIFALSSPEQSEDLRAAVGRVVDRAAETLPKPPGVRVNGPLNSATDKPTAANLLAVLGEALSNVSRHGNAHEVDVLIDVGELVTLTVSDDGQGLPDDLGRVGGLKNMRDRAEQLGGSFAISSSPSGTTVRWAVPPRQRL